MPKVNVTNLEKYPTWKKLCSAIDMHTRTTWEIIKDKKTNGLMSKTEYKKLVAVLDELHQGMLYIRKHHKEAYDSKEYEVKEDQLRYPYNQLRRINVEHDYKWPKNSKYSN